MSWAEPSCPTGKRVYLTWSHALFDARAMRRHKSNRANREQPYHCTTCSHTHVGQHKIGRAHV